MYITSFRLQNFCRLRQIEVRIPHRSQKGWHVIIGDNASGKSSILKGIASALINRPDFPALRINSDIFVRSGEKNADVIVMTAPDNDYDEVKTGKRRPGLFGAFFNKELALSLFAFSGQLKSDHEEVSDNFLLVPNLVKVNEQSRFNESIDDIPDVCAKELRLSYCHGWFSASYGPFRRLTGGNPQWQDLSNVAPRAAAHITLFDESAALTDVLDWLNDLDRRQLKEQSRRKPGDPEPESARIFNGVRHFINHSELLPGGVQFIEVNLDGVPVFCDANDHEVTVTQLSDGFRSILSVAFDLVRQLIRVYGLDKVFPPGKSDITSFPLPGVVLIDEVDAHLHPTWQTRIGQWFTTHFPEMQFIVTTHSPLICRACEQGTIWRLSPPRGEGGIEQITGAEKDRLVYGNVLDAYETQAFGAHMSRGEEGRQAQQEYLDLYYKRLYDVPMNEKEKARLEQLEAVFHSHVAIDED
ncbi:hypothetical protein BXU06_13870 [Aquaspirillum sp. LM1]|uniref:AAA family ATPase n=1 Tax=Aquaspirillum sp. LM1 TaxID=1938604 RepID=UPI000983A2BF|nr:ATP-binding protein [Aquaspirillum sp. LM1]AQR66020.1 hypothetical protein BXU06_13870 [Aquaspirillum sp. LM1]